MRLITPLLLALLMLCSCRPDGVDGEVLMQFTEIATFRGNDNPWGGALFTLRRDGDSPEIQLTTSRALADTYRAGQRVLILYTIPSNQPYTSGAIDLLGVGTVNNGKVTTLEEGEQWNADPVYLYSIWRTGQYLNLHVRLPYSTEPRRFWLALDPATATAPMPDLYLVHDIPDGANVTFDRSYYASYDISSVWQTATEGIRVHVENSNLDHGIFTFTKQPSNTTL
ncbi:MAG: hypothetical protein NC339_04135 [Muribaculaceae bacterium]|nr:hypothetical protein [Muribaculaceae bacterium]